MSVSLNPQVKQPLVMPTVAQTTFAAPKSLSCTSSLTSLALGQETDGKESEKPAKATKEDSNRGFCGTAWYVVTLPFVCVADCFSAIWNCLTSCCRSEKPAVETDPAKKVAKTKTEASENEKAETTSAIKRLGPANPFVAAVNDRRKNLDERQAAFGDLHGDAVQAEATQCVWMAMAESDRDVSREKFNFDKAAEVVDAAGDDFLKDVANLMKGSRLLAATLEKVKKVDIEKGSEDDRTERADNAKKICFDVLSKGNAADKAAGRDIQGRVVDATYVLQLGADISDKTGATAAAFGDFASTVGNWGPAVKDAWSRLSTGPTLLKDIKARKAMSEFSEGLGAILRDRGNITGEEVRFELARLEKKAPEAHKLLMLQLGYRLGENAKDAADVGKLFVANLSMDGAELVARGAKLICDFEDRTLGAAAGGDGEGDAEEL